MNFEMSEEEMKVLLYVTGAGLVTPVVGVTVVNTTLDTVTLGTRRDSMALGTSPEPLQHNT